MPKKSIGYIIAIICLAATALSVALPVSAQAAL